MLGILQNYFYETSQISLVYQVKQWQFTKIQYSIYYTVNDFTEKKYVVNRLTISHFIHADS